MLTTETLWRPADVYEANNKEALARGEACGLIVRSGQKIGFSHQSWLDDFQAKSFRSGGDAVLVRRLAAVPGQGHAAR